MIRKAKTIYLIGNGGSAANAEHIANDLVLAGKRAHALTNIAVVTCIANDFGYENVFSRQVALFCEPGDLLIALSGSGRSPNIIRAVETAKTLGVETLTIFGSFSSPLVEADIATGFNMQRAEERQLEIGHEWLHALSS